MGWIVLDFGGIVLDTTWSGLALVLQATLHIPSTGIDTAVIVLTLVLHS
jgi:hypothetical protein